ncbi:uncharacterized protein BKCO1_1400097 [Diplodia corticola]|uniref:Uncharacterized protein n=1 Tax=Diplodia corticola TaxID=236234 RepID=A0A1J9S7X2_9PEZI|nr:uncharacterized protein BKCO1_1400097 [Diplodia corticola]OJD36012.1 hypothetical protein BKCO1_1400097 [Diplodia corticola]
MSTAKPAFPNYDPSVHEGLQLASIYDRKITEGLQPVAQEPKYSTDNNWHEAPQVFIQEEPKYLAEDGDFSAINLTSPNTPTTPAPTYRTYPVNRVSDDGISLTRALTFDASTIDLEKSKSKKEKQKRICGCTRTVFWLSLALGVTIAVAASLAAGLLPVNPHKDD